MTDADGDPLFDGVLYPSRNNFPAACVALFDRAQHKLALVDDIDLADHVDWPGFVATYRIGIIPDKAAHRTARARTPPKGP